MNDIAISKEVLRNKKFMLCCKKRGIWFIECCESYYMFTIELCKNIIKEENNFLIWATLGNIADLFGFKSEQECFIFSSWEIFATWDISMMWVNSKSKIIMLRSNTRMSTCNVSRSARCECSEKISGTSIYIKIAGCIPAYIMILPKEWLKIITRKRNRCEKAIT